MCLGQCFPLKCQSSGIVRTGGRGMLRLHLDLCLGVFPRQRRVLAEQLTESDGVLPEIASDLNHVQLNDALAINTSSEIPSSSYSILAVATKATFLERVDASRCIAEMIHADKKVNDGTAREVSDGSASNMLNRNNKAVAGGHHPRGFFRKALDPLR